jgi:uncharacterized protein
VKEPFHAGEIAVQERAGVDEGARKIGRSIRGEIPDYVEDFLSLQPFAVAATLDADGRVWASLLTGAPGFLQAVDPHHLCIATQPSAGDPMRDNLAAGGPIGLLVIDLAERRRMRLNGRARLDAKGLLVETEQVYGNCPKYIQARDFVASASGDRPDSVGFAQLSAAQRDWITAADTFFIASYAADGGADASHRGGNPGFVRVRGPQMLAFPDYAGNNMFNTLGNLTANPRCGLLFVDFENGATLQLTGTARIDWTPSADALGSAERAVEFSLERGIETRGATALRWHFLEASPFNPE